jgi:cobalt-zinc-cadmium efflux system membrane fusion protein
MLKRLPTLLFGSAVCLGAVWSVWTLWLGTADSEAVEAAAAMSAGEPARVSLPAAKLEAIDLHVEPVTRRTLQTTVTAPGRLQYDDRRHVEIKSATEGVLVDIRVKTGDSVGAGAVVAIVSSPEIGTARADVLEREADLKVATGLRDWKNRTCEALERLSESVRSEQDMDSIREQFRGVELGSARELILGAYSRFLLARSVADSLTTASQSGAVPQRTLQEGLSSRDVAIATLDSALEQSLFEARQQCLQATNAAADAERRLQISRQHLRTLLGFVGEMATQEDTIDPESNLSLVEVRAPFSGTIERQILSANERVEQGQTLFVLADTSSLWISADLREREWAAAGLQPGDLLEVRFPVLAKETFEARVYFMGREVDPETNALPLVATIENADHRLRPGMFAEITLPVGNRFEAIAVPESAVCEHQGTSFVFLARGEAEFERVDVEPGAKLGKWTEIRSGLAEGNPVVTAGCFVLKSELLLEREE